MYGSLGSVRYFASSVLLGPDFIKIKIVKDPLLDLVFTGSGGTQYVLVCFH